MDVKKLLRDTDFRFNKQFGQNFLTDDTLLNGIVADAGIVGGTVLEIGAGAGTLTRMLCSKADKVIAYEIDRNLERILGVTLHGLTNVEVIIGDALKERTESIENRLNGAYKIVANIPYYITTPLLMKFLDEGKNVTSLTLTVQKEVAERITALPGSKAYGALTVGVTAVADARITRILDRNLFFPAPEVDSAVVRIDINRNKYEINDSAFFRKTVKTAFSMRRKTLVNNLISGFSINKEDAEKALNKCGIDKNARGETLSAEIYVKLCNYLKEIGC